jgi:ring-1,2-phenylacetyl-CoA epoxidase subunit PaaD
MAPMEPPPAPPGAVGGDNAVTCPWCGSDQVEQVAMVGPTVMTSSWICTACSSPFERVRKRGRS